MARLLLLFLVVGWFAPAPLAGADRKADPSRFVADAESAVGLRLLGETWESFGSDWVVELQRIDEAQRQDYFRRVAGLAIDPFASGSGRPTRFVSFAVRIVNSSENQLLLNPQKWWLQTDTKEVSLPLGLDGLRALFGVVGLESGVAYEKVRPAIIEHAVALDPGASVAGVLVYPPLEERTKRFRLDIQLTSSNGDVKRVTAAYRREKKKAKRQ